MKQRMITHFKISPQRHPALAGDQPHVVRAPRAASGLAALDAAGRVDRAPLAQPEGPQEHQVVALCASGALHVAGQAALNLFGAI